MNQTLRTQLLTALLILPVSAVYAVGFCWCYQPNDIAFGGITGLAQIINVFLPWAPVGTVTILLNVPLFLLGWRFLGGRLLLSSLYAMAATSLAIDIVDHLVVFPPMEPMLAAIFGGVILGATLGIIFLRGATTGGTDLAARLLKLRFQWLPLGKLLLAVDLLVIAATALAFQSLESALYGIVALYISSLVLDGVLYGLDTAKVAYIISEDSARIYAEISRQLDRGVTILPGRGGYSGQEKQVLLCAFKQREIAVIRAIVKGIDPDAFLIVCPAHEVLGEGFRDYKKNDL